MREKEALYSNTSLLICGASIVRGSSLKCDTGQA